MPVNLSCLIHSTANHHASNQTGNGTNQAMNATIQSYPFYSGHPDTKPDFRMYITPSTYLQAFELIPTSSSTALSCVPD